MLYQVRVLSSGQIYKIETTEKLRASEECLVEAEQIIEPAVVLCDKCPKRDLGTLPNATFLRIMKDLDHAAKKKLKEKACTFLEEAQTKALRHGLGLKIVDADMSFDEKKLTLYFTAEGRIDFRALVADMVGTFHKIIRLQQIGPREEARLMPGLGRCGQELCCRRFIKDLESVSSEMSVIQEMGGTRLSKMTGCCGRLMCCLSYEVDDIKNLPKLAEKMPAPETKSEAK